LTPTRLASQADLPLSGGGYVRPDRAIPFVLGVHVLVESVHADECGLRFS
jgi:hypothetical protein